MSRSYILFKKSFAALSLFLLCKKPVYILFVVWTLVSSWAVYSILPFSLTSRYVAWTSQEGKIQLQIRCPPEKGWLDIAVCMYQMTYFFNKALGVAWWLCITFSLKSPRGHRDHFQSWAMRIAVPHSRAAGLRGEGEEGFQETPERRGGPADSCHRLSLQDILSGRKYECSTRRKFNPGGRARNCCNLLLPACL